MKDKYSTLIKATWVVLICCFIVKLLGGNFFEIACNNEKFIRFCLKYQGTIVEYIIGVILYSVSTFLYFCAILKIKVNDKKSIKYAIIIFLFGICKRIWIDYEILLIILEILLLIVFPIILNLKNWYKPLIGYFLLFIFQVISLITKNIGVKIIDDNFLTAVIFSIDYYIMIILYYLYVHKEETKNGSIWNFISRNRKRRNDNSNS